MNHKIYLHLMIGICLKIVFVISENRSDILFDQRQTGKYNIHLSIKDVAIIEFGASQFLDDTSNDKEDYYYDEDDFTIKPWFSTSTKIPLINTSVTHTTPISNNISISTLYVTTIKNDLNITKPKETTTITAITNYSIEHNSPTLSPPTRKPLFNNKSQSIPVHIIMEPVLIPKLRTSLHKLPSQNNKDSRVVRLQTKQHHTKFPRMIMRCNNDGFIDENGNCRLKRSTTTIKKKMFNLLKKLSINRINRDRSNDNST